MRAVDENVQNLDDEESISPTVDHFINSVYGQPPDVAVVPLELSVPTRSPTVRDAAGRTNVELVGRVPWRAPNFFR